MLVYNEENRASWEDLFDNDMLRDSDNNLNLNNLNISDPIDKNIAQLKSYDQKTAKVFNNIDDVREVN